MSALHIPCYHSLRFLFFSIEQIGQEMLENLSHDREKIQRARDRVSMDHAISYMFINEKTQIKGPWGGHKIATSQLKGQVLKNDQGEQGPSIGREDKGLRWRNKQLAFPSSQNTPQVNILFNSMAKKKASEGDFGAHQSFRTKIIKMPSFFLTLILFPFIVVELCTFIY